MTAQPRPKTQALAGLVIGVIAVVLITAILTSAVSSSNADTRTEALAAKLEKVTNDLTALRDSDAQQRQVASKADQRNTVYQQEVMRQNQILRHQLYIVTLVLRRNGLEVPKLPPEPRPPEATTSPKVPAPTRAPHHSPGSPAPTEPSPSTPSPDPCELLPALCPFLSLPTLLP